MADAKDTAIYVKLGSDGKLIEREASTPSDHVNFRGTGWVAKDSAAGKRVASPKKSDDVSNLSPTSVTGHAAAATVASAPKTEPPASK